jgi:hypothetical protein
LDTPVASLMLKDLDLVDRFRIKLGRERKKRFLHILTYDAEVFNTLSARTRARVFVWAGVCRLTRHACV